MKVYSMILSVLCVTLTACSVEKSSTRRLFPDEKARALAVAVVVGDTNAIEVAIEKGADVDYVGQDGIIPLAWAMVKGNRVSFEYLLKKGADPNANVGEGDTVLFMALDVDDPYFLETALKYGGNSNQRRKWGNWEDGEISLLWYITSAVVPQPDKIKVLIEYGADIDELRHGGGVVRSCAMQNHYENVFIFLEAGAPFLTNREPSSLLYCLEDRGVRPGSSQVMWRDKVVAFLRERGIEVAPKEWKREDQPTIINIQTNLNIPR